MLLGIGRVEVSPDGAPWQPAETASGDWYFPWFAANRDGATLSLAVRAADLAGQTTQITETIRVDVVPPAPVDFNTGYLDGAATVPITPTETLYQAYPTLVLAWPAATWDVPR